MPLKPINTKHRLEELKHNPKRAFNFALITLKGRWPEAEPYIMKDASSAVNYAHQILKQPWPEAEPYILKSYNDAIVYTILVKQKKWPELEKIIDGNPRLVQDYNYKTRYLYS